MINLLDSKDNKELSTRKHQLKNKLREISLYYLNWDEKVISGEIDVSIVNDIYNLLDKCHAKIKETCENYLNENNIKIDIDTKHYLYEVYDEETERKDIEEYGVACGCIGFPRLLLAVDEDVRELQKIAKEQNLKHWVILDNND